MSTIGKALSLLDLLSQLNKDIGLTDLARVSALDKATARRFLVELEKHGFVEQDGETRKYRLGAAPVRLARIRQARFPSSPSPRRSSGRSPTRSARRFIFPNFPAGALPPSMSRTLRRRTA